MLPPLIDIEPFRDAILRDHLILTPNHRLAAKITDAWASANQNSVWTAPRVFSIDHWLKHCWDELQDQNHSLVSGLSVVGSQQGRYYWERAIAKHDPEHSSSHAKIASDTLKTLQNWNLKTEDIAEQTSAMDHFKRWLGTFNELLSNNHLITQQEAWQLIEQGFICGALKREEQILLYGFQSTPPLPTNIISIASSQISSIQTMQNNGYAVRIAVQDQHQELRLAAHWAAQQLQINAQQRIGLVVPDLNNSLDQVSRIVNEALTTEGTETVVNIHGRDVRRAAGQHPQQGRNTTQGSAVSNTRRNCDHRLVDESADHRGERALHPCHDDQHPRRTDHIERGEQTMQPCDAYVLQEFDVVPKAFGDTDCFRSNR